MADPLVAADPQVKIRTKNLNLHYGPKQALKNITLEIQQNLVTALIGPSGCGNPLFFAR